MNGADALVRATTAAGVDVCFANPGTTEMAMVGAITRSGDMRAVLALFEGVASGAADGYARISGRPAAVMLHLGAGLGNATANLHNARRAQSPLVNWVGEHSTWLLPYDPPLASDIESIARGTSKWIRTSRTADRIAFDAVDAIRAATTHEPGVATLIVPMDLAEAPLPDGTPCPPPVRITPRSTPVETGMLEPLAEALRSARSPLLLLGGHAADARALRAAARLAEGLGARLLLEAFPRCTRREPGLPSPERLAHLPMVARPQLASHDVIVTVGADRPALYFGYDGQSPSLWPEGCRVFDATDGGSCPHDVLARLLDLVDSPREARAGVARTRLGKPSGRLEPQTISQAIAHHLPEDAIVVDEGITSSLPLYSTLEGAAPHDYLACKGASIGFALPVATGAAVAAPGRRVVAYVGDGSAMYTIQSLWTQAREGLDVTTVILQNDKYAILQMELMRAGGTLEGPGASLTELSAPSMDFTLVARGFGVPAREVRDLESLDAALTESFRTPGPMLISCVFD
jgi:acetolactate synthase I/II/III large subunit